MARQGKLGKLKMPADRHGEDLEDLLGDGDSDHSDDDMGAEEHEAAESPDEEQAEHEPDGEESDEGDGDHSDYLAKCSDEDLMAEVRKRGLMGELRHGEDGSSGDSEHADNPGPTQDHGMY